MPEARFPQLLLDVHDELIVDLFAGGGGASLGIEMATGRQVDVAINHDSAAVALHRANHPQTDHHVSDVFEVDTREVTQGRPIGLLWASPDCTDHSKAKGGKPIRNRKRRALAWVVKRWAGQVRPRVICLENVEEFVDWGPLVGPPGKLRRCPKRKGKTFRRFIRELERLGYAVEWRELRACEYGAPTIRKRLFLVARCDGEPIVWPEPTHGEGLLPFRTAAECIDWSTPMLSIFATPEEAKAWARARRAEGWPMGTPRRPLAEATLRRIARGVVRYVLEAAAPFIVNLAQRGPREYPLEDPMRTQHAGGNAFGVVVPYVAPNNTNNAPQGIDDPLHTQSAGGTHHGLVAAHVQRDFGQSVGQDAADPLGTVTPDGGGKAALVASFLQKYYGAGVGQRMAEPVATVTTKDRMGLVTVDLDGAPFVIVDIAMRMLQPRELYRAQGFPDSYRIERGVDGRQFTKTEQVRMVGNSVSPQVAAALVRANCLALVARDEAREVWVA